MNFLNRLLGKGCSHQFSWPRLYTDGQHYQTCSRCGISYEYDWNTMQQTGRVKGVAAPNAAGEVAIARNEAVNRFPLAR
jgi:hypothetical protein